jgi:hypothetical protein
MKPNTFPLSSIVDSNEKEEVTEDEYKKGEIVLKNIPAYLNAYNQLFKSNQQPRRKQQGMLEQNQLIIFI